MTIEIPFDVGWVENNVGDLQQLTSITWGKLRNSTSVFYYNDKGQLLYPKRQLSEEEVEEFKKNLELKKLEKVQNIVNIFKEVFEDAHWDMTSNGNLYTFIIKFNEVTVQNRDNANHVIKDLYLKLDYDVNSKRFLRFEGLRKTLTNSELRAGYGHSHCSDGVYGWGSWCTGQGEFGILLNNVMMNDNPKLEDDLRAFLFAILPYLQWENLGAQCFKYIQRINSDERNMSDNSFHFDSPGLKDFLKNKDLSSFIQFDENTLQAKVITDLNFYKEVSSGIDDRYLCYYDDSLQAFYGIGNVNTNSSNLPDVSLKFKGTDVKLKIEQGITTDNLSTYNRFLSPFNINVIKNYIETNFIKILKQLSN